jgi:tetratricopeptide (TPR) repeat protein
LLRTRDEVTITVRDKVTHSALIKPITFQPRGADALIACAARLEAENQFGEAAGIYQEALQLAPDHPYVHIGLARCGRQRGDHAAALRHFEAAARLLPDDCWRHVDMAEELRCLDRLEEAETAYHAALRLAPETTQAQLGLGHCARRRGNREQALAWFQAAARIGPENIWPSLELAQEQSDAGDIAAARRTALALLRVHPQECRVLLSLARTEREDGNHAAALQRFAAAHEVAPGDATILVELAKEARALGRLEESHNHLAAALRLAPFEPEAVSFFAQQALVCGDLEGVHKVYHEAALERPNEVAFQLGLADVSAKMGKVAEALALLDVAVTKHGQLPALLAKRITLLRQHGDYHAAMAAARQATEAAAHDFWLWVERFLTSLLVEPMAATQACLDKMPAVTAREQAMKVRCAGMLAERHWQLECAVGHYEAAAAALVEDIGLQGDLLRLKLLQMDFAGARQNLYRYSVLQEPDRKMRGESINPTQNTYGQILDEYVLDSVMRDLLSRLRGLPPAAQLEPLRCAIRANPDSTAAAVALLVALRRAGGLHYTPPAPGGETIPTTIRHSPDPDSVPADVADLMRSWQAMNADYSVRIFNDRTAQAFLSSQYSPAVLAAYRCATEPAQKADIFRLALLAVAGGVYTDADDRCLAPLAAIIPAAANFVTYQENLGSVGNNFIAAVPRHPVLLNALQMVVTAINRGDTDTIWLLSGPGLLSRALAFFLAHSDIADRLPDGMDVLDLPGLHQAVAEHCLVRYKLSNSHWSNTVFSRRSGKTKSTSS